MRTFSPLTRGVLPLVAVALFTSASRAQSVESPTLDEYSYKEALFCAHADLEQAKLEYRLYRQVEYPAEQRRLDTAIKLARLEVKALERRERRFPRFEYYDSYSYGPTYEECNEANLLAAELRLRDLVAERLAWRRYGKQQFRVFELRVAQARARLLKFHGGGEIIAASTTP